jgi:rubredoxin
MKFRCSNCGLEFDESKLFIPISGCGLLCGICFQIDAKESYGDFLGHQD